MSVMRSNKMKKITVTAILLATTCTLLPASAHAEAFEGPTVVFHYAREDRDYANCHIWSWTEDSEGQEYDFIGEDAYGAWAQVSFDALSETKQIGFLVKIGDWEAGEVSEDRFLDLSHVKDGKLDVYILQNDSNVYYAPEEIPQSIRAFLDSFTEIRFEMHWDGRGDVRDHLLLADDSGSSYPLEVLSINDQDHFVSGTVAVSGLSDLRKTLRLRCGELVAVVHPRGVFDDPEFQERCCYAGEDLGANWTETQTSFRLWAPTAAAVEVLLYRNGTDGDPFYRQAVERSEGGSWYCALNGDLDQVYYTYRINVEDKAYEVVDPYAKSCGSNGQRGMIFNPAASEPQSFYDEVIKAADLQETPIIYEMSIRDFSMDPNASFAHPGTYRAVVQKGVHNSAGDAAGIDYLEELGITYVHLMPAQDSPEVDERDPTATYNWGYMTKNFFTPEGAYSIDPENGAVRIEEFKKMVSGLHQRGIGVIMDVVYNHTAGESVFEQIVPGYYYRQNADGSFSNGSSCGNELATERIMVRKLIIDSVCYWLEEYHVDGFRFDLMGLMDLDTLQEIQKQAAAIRPDVLLYGEGWTGGKSCYEGKTGMSGNAAEMPGIAVFSNIYRGAVQQYMCGIFELRQSDGEMRDILPDIRFGVVAATENPATSKVGSWTLSPMQCVNYASCHDGYTLWDLIRLTNSDEPEDIHRQRKRFEASVTLMTQGIPFFMSGEEFLRSKTKNGDINSASHNSYNASDTVNCLRWDLVGQNADILSYYKGLIAFRKEHTGMWMRSTEDIQKNLRFLDSVDEPALGYIVREKTSWWQKSEVCVIHNPLDRETSVLLPSGSWKVNVRGGQAGTQELDRLDGNTNVSVAPISTLVLTRDSLSAAGWCAVVIAIAAAFGAALYVCKKRARASGSWHSSK